MNINETGNEGVDQLRLAQDTERLAGYITLHREHWVRPGINTGGGIQINDIPQTCVFYLTFVLNVNCTYCHTLQLSRSLGKIP
jgi:hypothetical protein